MTRKVEDVDIGPGMTAADMISQFGRSGVFGAGRLHRAAKVYEEMLASGATVFLGLAGAMVPGGMRRVVAEMIRDGMVDILVSTGANITHDLMCSFGIPQWRELSYRDDAQLRSRGISRIYDSFLDQKAFDTFEKRIGGLLKTCLEPEEIHTISPSGLLRSIGEKLDDRSSIVFNAAERDVPIFVPAFTDSILGMQTFFFSQRYPLTIDVLDDLRRIIDLSYTADPSGAILIGGGVPKNFILQSKLVAPKGFTFSLQITTDRPDPGGLSGATLEEAISWGKLEEHSKTATVYGDATIILPIIVAAVRESLARKGKEGGADR